MKTSRACTGMLFHENNPFKFSKTAKTQTAHSMHHVHHNSRARGTVSFLQASLPLTRNMNVKVAVELCYIFSKISKLRYW